jgi:pyruvate-formate lyase-activating enzyme
MYISNINTGFIDIPSQISMNIYAQGCSLNCKDCQSPDLQPFNKGPNISLEDIKIICEQKILPTWICWLGGDATYQPDDFQKFNKYFKEKHYGVGLYTGRLFKEVEDLLENVDLVIDGPWRGIPVTDKDTNQKVYLKQNGIWEEVSFNSLPELLNI